MRCVICMVSYEAFFVRRRSHSTEDLSGEGQLTSCVDEIFECEAWKKLVSIFCPQVQCTNIPEMTAITVPPTECSRVLTP